MKMAFFYVQQNYIHDTLIKLRQLLHINLDNFQLRIQCVGQA